MTTNLFNLNLQEVPEADYVCYSFKIPYEPLANLFAKASDFKGTRFFWQTPDKNVGFLGVGRNLLKKRGNWSTEDLINTKQEFFKKLSFLVPEKETPILFGGLPFDAENKKQAPIWGELAEGCFILPELLIKQNHQQLTVVITARNHFKTLKKLDEFIKEKMRLINEMKERCVPDFSPSQILKETEVAVPHFLKAVEETIEVTANKKSALKKVVLARQMQLVGKEFSVEKILLHLISQQPNTYLFVLEAKGQAFIGATPERLLQATDTHFLTASIAGSIARSSNKREDVTLGEKLLKDSKNIGEHQLVVERLTEQMHSFIKGKLTVSEKSLLKNRDIQHLCLTLKGSRQDGFSFLEVIRQLHPSPALGGVPKQAAIDWIAEKEPIGRGLYGGPIGWCSLTEDVGEFAVGIRSGVVSDTEVQLYAGCGIVPDSTAEAEYLETALKFQPMIRGVKE